MRIHIAQINPTIGDLDGNVGKILHAIQKARRNFADLVLFPELALTGYPPEDFLLLPHFIDEVYRHLDLIIEASEGIAVVVGMPRRSEKNVGKMLYNSAAIISNQSLCGFQDKYLLPTYDVFDERRYFQSSDQPFKLWEIAGKKIGVTICEDIWQHQDEFKDAVYELDPILELKKLSPNVVVNLSASPYGVSKFKRRLEVSSKAAASLKCPFFYCNQVGACDSLIFDGYSMYLGADGSLLEVASGFAEDDLLADLSEKKEPFKFDCDTISDLYQALVLGVRDYFQKSGFSKACLGVSGGIDSALVACIAKDALGAENVLGISMPSEYSSEGSVVDAYQLAQNLGMQYRKIEISGIFQNYLDLLNPEFENKAVDVTEENLQARIRGIILMAISNKLGFIVLSTGNKSELAVGYSTLYGDMCGGLSVISDVSKSQVYALAKWINRTSEIIPWNTIHKAPSAELKPNQKDSDSLPDYEVLDAILKAYVEDQQSALEISLRFGYSLALVEDLIKRIHRNEYKRRQSPLGLRVSEKSFSIGRRFPIVQHFVW